VNLADSFCKTVSRGGAGMQKWTVIRENAGERPQKGRRNVDEGTWMEERGWRNRGMPHGSGYPGRRGYGKGGLM